MTVDDVLARIHELGIPGYGDDEVRFMAETMLQLRPDHVFDWGTNVGASARIFYEVGVVGGIDCQVHSVDLPADVPHIEHPGDRYAQLLEGLPVDLHRGDGATISTRLCHQLRPGPLRPLFFVDGDHQAENVFRELRLVYTYAPRAVCLIHDTRAHSGDGVRMLLQRERSFGDGLDVTFLPSQAGMTRLWPR